MGDEGQFWGEPVRFGPEIEHWRTIRRFLEGDRSVDGVGSAREALAALQARLESTSSVLPFAQADWDAVATGMGQDSDETASRILSVVESELARPTIYRASDTPPPMPELVLRAAGKGGALASVGTVSILSGPGGTGKSSLAFQMGVGLAMLAGGTEGILPACNMFEGVGCRVMLAGYEDPPGLVMRHIQRLVRSAAKANRSLDEKKIRGISIMHLQGHPLWGPAAGDRSQIAGPLPMWKTLWDTVKERRVRLVIIDPAMAAFVGNGNAAAEVRRFLDALAAAAQEAGAAVLLVAHSTKAARVLGDPFAPGQIGGSSQWYDGARGVLTLSKLDKGAPLTLAVSKANWGPAGILCELEPAYVWSTGRPLGYGKKGDWIVPSQLSAGDPKSDRSADFV